MEHTYDVERRKTLNPFRNCPPKAPMQQHEIDDEIAEQPVM